MEKKEQEKREKLKNEHRSKVKDTMLIEEEERKERVMQKIGDTEAMIISAHRKKEIERQEKMYNTAVKRADREETVKRIAKMKEYEKEKLLEKIEGDTEKAMKIKREKAALLETRGQLRKQIDNQKARVMTAFEKMKKKGKMDVNMRILKGSA